MAKDDRGSQEAQKTGFDSNQSDATMLTLKHRPLNSETLREKENVGGTRLKSSHNNNIQDDGLSLRADSIDFSCLGSQEQQPLVLKTVSFNGGLGRDWLGQVYGSSGKGDGHEPAYVPTNSPMVIQEEEEAMPGDTLLERSLTESQSGFVGVRKKAGVLQAARTRLDFLGHGFKENDTISEEDRDSKCEDEVPTCFDDYHAFGMGSATQTCLDKV